MTMCGTEIERYDVVADTVPFVRIATYCEAKLLEAEKMEERLRELKNK